MLVVLALVGGAVFAAVTLGSPPVNVTPTILARGTFQPFNVRSDPQGPIDDFRAHSTGPIDIIVRQHDYQPGGSTGWHQHPGPIFVTVTKGQLTYYEADDPTCTPHVVSAGQGFVDTGDGHIVRNETTQPAQDISVITAPVGGAFRTELPAPNPYCGF
jgi:quercetin dioxygenase-like cupin family protein